MASTGGRATATGGVSADGGHATGGAATPTGGAGGTGGTNTGGAAATGGASAGTGGTLSGTGGGSVTGGSGARTGTGGSGGTAGAMATGGRTGGSTGSSSCAGKTYKLCEDFESGAVDGLPTGWTALKSYGPAGGVGLANDQAHGGTQSLKTNTSSTGAGRIQHSLSALGATATNHWGRLFFKAKTPAPTGQNGAYYHVTFAALQGTTENRVVDTVEDPSGKVQFIFNVPDDSCCTGSSYDWKHDGAWHCAEWQVNVGAQSYRFFIDGKEVTSIGFTGNANAKMSSYTALALGAIFYVTPTGPWVSWIDDLAIDDKQIGCL